MDHVESNSIPSNPLKDLRRIEFSAIVSGSSLVADLRAFLRFLLEFVFLRAECSEFYEGFYIESPWNLRHANRTNPTVRLAQKTEREDLRSP